LNFAANRSALKVLQHEFFIFSNRRSKRRQNAKNEKLKLLNFLSTPWIENTPRELISDIKNYEGVIDLKLIDI
jgi:hypothetical protein